MAELTRPDELAQPIELAPGVQDGAALVGLYEALCRRTEVGWLRFRLSSVSDGNEYGGPQYRLTAQWRNGPEDPPQPGPRAALIQQIDWVKAFVVGWMAAR